MIPAKSINGSKTFTEMPFAIAGNFERKIKLPPTNTSSIASPSIILKSATQILKIKVLSWVVIFFSHKNIALAASHGWRESQFVKATLEQTVMIKITGM